MLGIPVTKESTDLHSSILSQHQANLSVTQPPSSGTNCQWPTKLHGNVSTSYAVAL
jgi:hypothetical protein